MLAALFAWLRDDLGDRSGAWPGGRADQDTQADRAGEQVRHAGVSGYVMAA
ncbi:hypothetical protein ACFQ7B_33590 [Streptomyces erythrochromogenes]|uniref:hypothetical protein n=1 Tax=Streptomyces erythrochromogenes TaxID=285574 RepID=UPI003675DC84